MGKYAFRLALESQFSHFPQASCLRPHETKYGIASAAHYECSVTLYFSQLRRGLNGVNADAIFACCHSHSMLAFRNMYLTWTELLSDSAGGYAHGWWRALQGTKVSREHCTLKPEADWSIWFTVCIEAICQENVTCNGGPP